MHGLLKLTFLLSNLPKGRSVAPNISINFFPLPSVSTPHTNTCLHLQAFQFLVFLSVFHLQSHPSIIPSITSFINPLVLTIIMTNIQPFTLLLIFHLTYLFIYLEENVMIAKYSTTFTQHFTL